MTSIPDRVIEAWKNKEPKLVFSTVSADGNPNTVWIACVNIIDKNKVLIVNNFFNKTLENVQAGSKGSLLFIAPEREAYQLKGSLKYYTEGPIYDQMKSWLDPKFAGVGAVVMTVEEIYYGAEKIV